MRFTRAATSSSHRAAMKSGTRLGAGGLYALRIGGDGVQEFERYDSRITEDRRRTSGRAVR
jgi:hypothetical protein